MRLLESQLEDSGYPQLAQVVRWLSFWTLSKHDLKWGLTWSNLVVWWDIGMRRIVQREIYVQEELKALQKSQALSSGSERESTQLRAYETELHGLDHEYWRLSSILGRLEGEMPAGVLSKAFKSCRANPDWYLCQWLRQDCARRGGCCGRDCGCCEKARMTKRRWNRGHCTSVCGCCIRTQGRSNISVGQSELEDIGTFNIASTRSQYELS